MVDFIAGKGPKVLLLVQITLHSTCVTLAYCAGLTCFLTAASLIGAFRHIQLGAFHAAFDFLCAGH